MRSIIIASAAASVLMSSAVHAQSWQPPADSQRCPSRRAGQIRRRPPNAKLASPRRLGWCLILNEQQNNS
jgi:hypothetical protein